MTLFYFRSYSRHSLQPIWFQTLFLGAGRSFLWSLCHHQKKVVFNPHVFSLLPGLEQVWFSKQLLIPIAYSIYQNKFDFVRLRYSNATHVLESLTDLRYIQKLVGHSSSKTTEIYTHVSTKSLQQIKSPFDDL